MVNKEELSSCSGLMHSLYALWGTDDVVDFIDNVIFTQYDSTNPKYTLGVMSDLLLLKSIHTHTMRA